MMLENPPVHQRDYNQMARQHLQFHPDKNRDGKSIYRKFKEDLERAEKYRLDAGEMVTYLQMVVEVKHHALSGSGMGTFSDASVKKASRRIPTMTMGFMMVVTK